MPFPTGGLNEHRIQLSNNPKCFTEDKERSIKNWILQAWKWLSKSNPSVKKNVAVPLLREMAIIVWEAQGERPLFHFDSVNGLPLSWNRPQDGLKNYVRYEIGHMTPVNSGGLSQFENLCYQSARCNQHIQSSLSLDEVLESYFQNNQEVLDRVSSVFISHQTTRWKEIKKLLLP